ncbi:MAG: PAC2 family protein [Actinomycetia bacterium]|nr:PAC2 family protein [Actinomycetes bacterium]
MKELLEVHEHPSLSEPVMVVALEGWIDAGMSAAGAISTVASSTDASAVASFDADRIIDHRARRPVMQIVNGLITNLEWPATEVHAGVDSSGNDLLLLQGAEPDFEWQAFTRAVIELAEDFEVARIVYLGAYPAPVPHTRGVNLAVTTSSPDLSDELRGYVRGSLAVPGGIHAVIDVEANSVGIPTLGLWAQVPHYISSMQYPAASLALVDGLRDVAGLDIDVGELAGDAAGTRDRLDALVAENQEHQEMVRQLEEVFDTTSPDDEPPTPIGLGEMPSGDELAAELQEFLQQRPEED